MGSRKFGLGVLGVAAVMALTVPSLFGPGQNVARATEISKECQMEALEQTACAIELILQDLRANYSFSGGGGISNIHQTATTTFVVTVGRDESDDTFTYEFAFAPDGSVTLISGGAK